jgi:sarcosine oxidase subunit gamma
VPETPARQSALEGHYREGPVAVPQDGEAGLRLAERRDLALVQLDLGPGDAEGRKAAGALLGLDLPTTPGLSAKSAAGAALWTGPGRWLLCLPVVDGKATTAALAEALAGRHHAVIDLTQARTVIRASGPRLRDLLSKGVPIDLHPRAFPEGACAVTSLAHVTGTLHHVEEGIIDLTVMRSFGLHLWDWLHEAGEEYGIEVLPAMTG